MDNFKDLIKNFCTEINALAVTMPMSSNVLLDLLNVNYKKFGTFLKENCDQIDKDESNYKFSIPEKEFNRYTKFTNKLDELKISTRILPRMYIITLVCQFDAFIGNLISIVLESCPEILNGSERTLSFENISSFNSLKDARQYIIDQEIDSILRKSHNDHLLWFEKKLKISLRSDKDLLNNFFELTERRNLFAHNNGIVNDSYIKNCTKLTGSNNQVKIGDYLSAPPEYYDKAIITLLEIAIKLGHIVWRKIDKGHLEATEQSINSISYELIKNENYNLAIKIINFALTDYRSFTSSSNRLLLIINIAQCYLWKGDEVKANEIIDKEDWSCCSDDYLIAQHVIKKNYSEVIRLLSKDNHDSLIDKSALIEWPLFKELRETNEFNIFFEKKYIKTIEEVYEEENIEIIKAAFYIDDEEEKTTPNKA